jgi:hypothetical protein
MEDLGKEIRKEISKIYSDTRRLKKLQKGRERLLFNLKKIKRKKQKRNDFENKPITI